MGFDPISTRNNLNNSRIQQSNPPLYDCINNLLTGLTELFSANQIDYGTSFTYLTDTNGTRINFNKTFTSAIVICIARSPTGGDAFCITTDVQNTNFTVMAFTHAGARQSVVIDWIAYGIKG